MNVARHFEKNEMCHNEGCTGIEHYYEKQSYLTLKFYVMLDSGYNMSYELLNVSGEWELNRSHI